MRLPQSLVGPNPKPSKKKIVDAVSLCVNSETLQELAVRESGNSIQCLVPVCLGDKLSVNFHIPCGEFEIVDLVIDGILRETSFNNRLSNLHKGTFTKVCHCERRDTGSMGRILHYEMVVTERTKTHDTGVGLGNFSQINLAAVGTIEIKVYRQIPANIEGSQGALLVQAERSQTFEKYAAWWELNKLVDINAGDPPYQIGFTDPKAVYGACRKNINKDISGSYLWACFKYVYRSVDDIKAMGFAVAEDSSRPSSKSERDQYPHSVGMSHSPTVASHDTASGEESFSEEDSPFPLAEKLKEGPTSFPYASSSSPATSLTGKKKSNSSKLGGGKSGPRTLILPPGKKRFLGDNFPVPVDDNYQNISEGEDDFLSSFEHPKMKLENGSNRSGVTGGPLPQLPARFVELKAEGDYATKTPEADVRKANEAGNSLLDLNISPPLLREESEHSRELEEVIRHSVKSSYPSQSLSTEVESKFAAVKPTGGIELDGNNGMGTQDLLNSVLSGFKDKDGRNFTDLSPVEASGYISNSATKKSIRVQAHLEDPPMKRKHEEFSSEGIIDTRPSFRRGSSLMGGTEGSVSKKARREEHARKRQIKKQALDVANSEAKAFRKRLEEIEAKEAAAIAKEEAEEEAELEEIDRAIELAKQESEALKARIQELENPEID